MKPVDKLPPLAQTDVILSWPETIVDSTLLLNKIILGIFIAYVSPLLLWWIYTLYFSNKYIYGQTPVFVVGTLLSIFILQRILNYHQIEKKFSRIVKTNGLVLTESGFFVSSFHFRAYTLTSGNDLDIQKGFRHFLGPHQVLSPYMYISWNEILEIEPVVLQDYDWPSSKGAMN